MNSRPDRLIQMANQIAAFFATQEEGAEGAAVHLRKFWDPSMRADLIAWRRAGGEGLDPIAAAAVDALAPKP